MIQLCQLCYFSIILFNLLCFGFISSPWPGRLGRKAHSYQTIRLRIYVMTGATPNEKTKTSNNYKSGFIDTNSLVKSPQRKEIQEVVQSNVTLRSVDPSLEQTITKQYLAIVLDRSWKLVQDLINDKGLQSCEVGLREATSLLVLATLRGAADVYASSKATVEWMFRSADVNHDGQLTYVEWYDWLMQRDRSNNYEEGGNSLIQAFNPVTGEKIIFPPDPMILDLEQVLSHAVTSLYYTSRLSDDPNVLIAAYISAGMTPGILDPSFSGTMLSRLPGVIRELIIHAITLEATKITAASSSSFFLPASPKPALAEGEQTKVSKKPAKASKTLNATSTVSTVVLQPFNMDRKSYLQSYGYKRHKFKKIIHDIAPPPLDTSKSTSVRSQLLPLSSSALISPLNVTNSLRHNEASSGFLPSENTDLTLPEKKNLVGKRVVYIKPRKRPTLQPTLQAKSLVHQHLAHTKQVVEDVLLTLPSSNRDISNAMKANQITNSSVFVSKAAPFPQDDDDVGIVTYDGYDVMIEPTSAADHDSEIISESVIHRENKSNNEIPRKENSWKVSAVIDASDGLTLENQNLYKREIVLRMSANIEERSVALPQSTLKASPSSSQSSPASSSLLSPSIASSTPAASSIVIEIDEDNEELIRSYERFIQEMNQLQESITEFDDQECKQLRQLLTNRLQEIGPNQESIMAIILSLRLSRLQNLQRDNGSLSSSSNLFPSPIPASSFPNFGTSASSLSLLSSRTQDHYRKNPHHPSHIFHNRKKFFKAFQQQLAMETIQIWSPLSHQFEFSKLLPELELQSFYYLFPRSFHSFLTWYQLFYPLANRIIQKFQGQFVSIIRNDPLILKYCNKMIIDSRIKSEHSSYTKMFQQAKQRDDLFDLIGIRVIFSVISHSTTTPTSSSRRKRKNSNIEVEDSIVTVDVVKSNEKVNEVESDGYEDALYDTSEDDDDSVGHEFSEEYRQHYNDTEIIISRSNKPVAAEELPEEITQHLEELRQRRLEQRFQKQTGSGANLKQKRKRKDQSEHKSRQDIPFDTTKQKDNRGGKGSPTGVLNTMTVEECLVLNRIKEIVKELTEWNEDSSRFKDYVTHPKASGYQSIHMNFVHQPTKFRIELQIRSERMHYNAEFGTASHKYYKALLLPSSIKR